MANPSTNINKYDIDNETLAVNSKYAFGLIASYLNTPNNEFQPINSPVTDNLIAASSNNKNAIAITSKYIILSTDNAETWSIVYTNSANTNTGCMIYNSYAFVTTNSSILYRSTDYGATWSQLNLSSIEITSLNNIIQEAGYVIAVGNSGQIAYSNNNGSTFYKATVPSNFTDNLYGVSIYYPYEVAVGNNGAILYSSDYGVTWTKKDSPDSSAQLRALYHSSGGQVIAVGLNGVIFYSTSHGNSTWVQKPSYTTQHLFSVGSQTRVNENPLITGAGYGDNSSLAITSDYATTVQKIYYPGTSTIRSGGYCSGNGNYFIVGDNGVIYLRRANYYTNRYNNKATSSTFGVVQLASSLDAERHTGDSVVTTANYPTNATTSKAGLVKLATATSNANENIVTKSMKPQNATTSIVGINRYATNAEIQNGTGDGVLRANQRQYWYPPIATDNTYGIAKLATKLDSSMTGSTSTNLNSDQIASVKYIKDLYKAVYSGSQWDLQPLGFSLSGMINQFGMYMNRICIGIYNGVKYSSDGGITFSNASGINTSRYYYHNVAMNSNGMAYAIEIGGSYIYQSTNYGQSWSIFSSSSSLSNLKSVAVSSTHVYIVADGGSYIERITHEYDDVLTMGSTGSVLAIDTYSSYVAIVYNDNVVEIKKNGSVYTRKNVGFNGSSSTKLTAAKVIINHNLSSILVWLYNGSQSQVYITNDDGQNWRQLSSSNIGSYYLLNQKSVNNDISGHYDYLVNFAMENDYIIQFKAGQIQMSYNGGRDWIQRTRNYHNSPSAFGACFAANISYGKVFALADPSKKLTTTLYE